VTEPSVLLLDEPLSALDPFLRIQVRAELKRLQKELGTTFIHVTHSQEEAMALSDLVVVMNVGRIEHAAAPREVFSGPATAFVGRFIGGHNVIARPKRPGLQAVGLTDVPLDWLLYSEFSVVLAFVHLYTLFMMVPIFNSMARIDHAPIETARDAGASGWQPLWNVVIPLCKLEIVIGSIFVLTIVMGISLPSATWAGSRSPRSAR
jgi:hypothetical protein